VRPVALGIVGNGCRRLPGVTAGSGCGSAAPATSPRTTQDVPSARSRPNWR